jgi:adenylylsulfate reductase subunit A
VALVEKAFLERSGCLAAGVNALNAYVGRGKTPEDYVEYALFDAHGIGRRDLLLSMARLLNKQADFLEGLGLGIHRDSEGRRLERGWRNLRVNGENLKPLLAREVLRSPNVEVFERSTGTHILTLDNKVFGLMAIKAGEGLLFFETGAVIVATGGAAGLYKSQNPASIGNGIWYSPFNLGGGLALGIRAGAEMTSLEMRFVALRCKDTMAPTGTLALGAGAQQLNGLGWPYESSYGITTSRRVLAARREIAAGRGPCHLSVKASLAVREELYRAYLNMCPAQTLKLLEERWASLRSSEKIGRGLRKPYAGPGSFDPALAEAAFEEELLGWAEAALAPGGSQCDGIGEGLGQGPGQGQGLGLEALGAESEETIKVEIGASEPYVQGGHTAGGYWVDTQRRTTIGGLWAIGDAAGGAPQKYVTGSMAEGEMAAISVSETLLKGGFGGGGADPTRPAARLAREAACELRTKISREKAKTSLFGARELTEALQNVMDVYAGGVWANYRYNQRELNIAAEKINELIELGEGLTAFDQRGLVGLWEAKDALVVARSLIAHLGARKETRWPGFGEHSDYPECRDDFLCYVNSVFLGDRLETFLRPLVKDEVYEHPGEKIHDPCGVRVIGE